MATLTAVSPARAATLLTGEAAEAGGDDFVNDGKKLLVIEHTNGAGADVTLTLTTETTVDGEAVADKTITIVKGTRQVIGTFPKSIYNDANEKVSLGYSAHGDIEVAVIDLS